MMSAFSISGILTAVFSAGLGAFVYLRSTNRSIGKIWLLFSWSTTMWGMGAAWIGVVQDVQTGLLAWKTTYGLGVIWIAPLFFHFVDAFLERNRSRLVQFNYIVGGIFTSTLPTNYFFDHARYTFGQFTYAIGGPIYPVFFLWWVGLVILSHVELARAMNHLSAIKKNQIQYFFIATAFGFMGGSLCYLPNFGFDVYPWGNFAVPAYPMIMAYAMVRFHLMDVRLFVRRAFVMIAIYVLLIVATVPFLFVLHKGRGVNSSTQMIVDTISVSFLLSLGPVIYAYFIRHNFWLKERLSVGLTHELKSPLNAIASAADILLDRVHKNPKDVAALKTYIEMIQRNASRLDSFVADLLTVAKASDQTLAIHRRMIDFNDVLSSQAHLHQPAAERKGVHLELQRNGPLTLSGDQEKLELVLSNLLSNAVKYSNGGTICVRSSMEQRVLFCTVSDQGIGISKVDLDRVFDRFYQGKNARGGAGLGLAIAQS